MENKNQTKPEDKLTPPTSLIQLLDKAVHKYWVKNGRSTETVIIINPETWRSITKLLYLDSPFAPPIYKGCKVLRSYDIPKGEFEILSK